MALLVFVCATIFAWVWFLLVKNSESDTTTETRPEPNPESCHNQVPTTKVQEATSRTHITLQPVMWKPEQASAVLPDSTDSMDKNTEKSPVDHFPAAKISEEYVKNLENDNQNLKNEIGVCQNRLHNVSAMLHGVEEIVEEKERLQDEVKYLNETVAKYESDSRNQEKLDSDELTQLRDENSKLKTNLELSDRTVSLQSDEIQNLMDTTNDLNNKLKETLLQYDELMDKDVASEVAKDESDSEKIQPQDGEKPDDNDELIKQLVDENSNLKTNLETSACMMSFQSEEIKNLTARSL
jgi:chromosome segregation ATPase